MAKRDEKTERATEDTSDTVDETTRQSLENAARNANLPETSGDVEAQEGGAPDA